MLYLYHVVLVMTDSGCVSFHLCGSSCNSSSYDAYIDLARRNIRDAYEGTVNKAKAIKRGMYNRANADVLRAKMIYAGLKWDWNHHPN